MNKGKIVIIGAGISGMATAAFLKLRGLDVLVIEEASKPGGKMISLSANEYTVDLGPNSGLETSPHIKTLVDYAGLGNEFIYSNPAAAKRYIFRNGNLHCLAPSPAIMLKTKLFSFRGKLRILKEPFVGKSDDGWYQSIADFVRRRLGEEFLDYAIDPFISGVFAGDPEKLSVKSAFPKLYRLEEVYGGLIKGMIKGARERKKSGETSKQHAKMFSFINGMQSLPLALHQKLSNSVLLDTSVKRITKDSDKYIIQTVSGLGESAVIAADCVISTIPAYSLSNIIGFGESSIIERLKAVYYPPVKVSYLGFNTSDLGIKPDGFGFLIPSKEKKKFLGAIWSSAIFPNRAPEGISSFTLFTGGAKAGITDFNDVLAKDVLKEFTEIMQTASAPVYQKEMYWPKAIPQYNIGYIEYENAFSEFENSNFGFFISGNFRGGISVGDCIKSANELSERIAER